MSTVPKIQLETPWQIITAFADGVSRWMRMHASKSNRRRWQSKVAMHDATHHYFRDAHGNLRKELIRLRGVPCDAALFGWPSTKTAWGGESCWLIRLCEYCAKQEGIEW